MTCLPNWFPIGRVSKFSQVSEFQNATAYQMFHAIELYLKYAILSKNGNCWGHDVTDLYKKYKELYPSIEFHFDHPFDFSIYEASPENPGEKEFAVEHMRKYKTSIMDQHLRYPADDKTGGYSFSLSHSYFNEVEKKLLSLHAKINNS